MNKNLGIIIGHSEESQGSISYNGQSEFSFNSRVAEIVRDLLYDYAINTHIYTKKALNYTDICNEYLTKNIDMSLELHFNSFYKTARGMEALIIDKKTSFFMADKFTNILSEELGILERHQSGVKLLKRSDRGYVCLKDVSGCAKSAMLIEPCFGNIRNEDSVKLFEAGGDLFYARALTTSIIECLGINKNDYVTNLEFENIKLRGILSKIKQLLNC